MTAWHTLAACGRQNGCYETIENRQRKWLLDCLSRNQETHYGRKYRFDTIQSTEDFRRQVPLANYQDLAETIARMADGEPDVLFKGMPPAFEQTSGTTGGKKLIPCSGELLGDFRKALLPWLSQTILKHGIVHGSAYFSLSPATRKVSRTSGGIRVGLNDGEYLGPGVLQAFTEISAVPAWVGEITNIDDWRLTSLYYLVRDQNLVMLSVWSPTFMLAMLEGLDRQFYQLEKALDQGYALYGRALQSDREALNRLRLYQQNNNLKTLWPELKLVSCWADGWSKTYTRQLKKRIPYAAFEAKGLLATEAVMTVPDWDGHMRLAADSGFFEFLDSEENAYRAEELEDGKCYEMVITNSAGLYRYRIGDHVICRKTDNGGIAFQLGGRGNLVSDIAGEKLHEQFVAECVEDIPGFRMLLPEANHKPRYQLVADKTTKYDWPAALTRLETRLCENPCYAYARRLGQLQKPVVRLIERPLEKYLRSLSIKGTLLGNIKVPALTTESNWIDFPKESLDENCTDFA
jgi:hypothetical protein